MTLKERYAGVIGWFEANMPVAESELQYKDPYQLLVAVILSAQCTDKRVNMTTPALFEAYPTPEAMAQATAEAWCRRISTPCSDCPAWGARRPTSWGRSSGARR